MSDTAIAATGPASSTRFATATACVLAHLAPAGVLQSLSIDLGGEFPASLQNSVRVALEQLGATTTAMTSSTAGSVRVAGLAQLVESSPVIANLGRAAWADAAIRYFAQQTNLLVSSSRVLIVGSGPLALALANRLAVMGAVLSITSDDAPALLSFAGRSIAASVSGGRAPAIARSIDLIVLTGEAHSPLHPDGIEPDPGHPLLVLDASPPAQTETASPVDSEAFALLPTVDARDEVRGYAASRDTFFLVAADSVDPTYERTVADARIALALLVVAIAQNPGGPATQNLAETADRTLAEVLLK